MLRVLGHRRFAALFASQVASLLGTGVLTVALALLAVRIDSGAAGQILGTALTIRIAAYVIVSPLASALLAGRSSRAVLIGADGARVLIAGSLFFATDAWHVYLAILALQSASAVFTPTYQAVIPEVLTDEEDYTAAQSLSRLAYDLESLVSPVLAALLVLVIAPSALFLVTASGFVLSALAVALSGVHERLGAPGEPFGRRLSVGLALLARQRELRFLALLDGATAAVYGTVLVSTVVILLEADLAAVDDPSAPLALALTLFGAGSIVVALMVPRLLRVVTDRRLMTIGAVTAAVSLGVTAALLAVERVDLVALSIAWFVLGAATSAISTPSARIIRRAVPSAQRPAAFAARFSTSHAWYALTYPTAGVVGALAGTAVATAVLAALAVVVTLAALLASRPPKHGADSLPVLGPAGLGSNA